SDLTAVETAVLTQDRIIDVGVEQVYAGGQHRIGQPEEAQAGAGIQVDSVTLAVAQVTGGGDRLVRIARNIHLADDVIDVAVEEARGEHTTIIGQAVFQRGLVIEFLFLAQVRVTGSGFLVHVIIIGGRREALETELGYASLNQGSELQVVGHVKAVVELGTDELEVTAAIDHARLGNGGVLVKQGALQGHAIVQRPVVYGEAFIAHFFHRGAGVRGAAYRHQTAIHRRSDPVR